MESTWRIIENWRIQCHHTSRMKQLTTWKKNYTLVQASSETYFNPRYDSILFDMDGLEEIEESECVLDVSKVENLTLFYGNHLEYMLWGLQSVWIWNF